MQLCTRRQQPPLRHSSYITVDVDDIFTARCTYASAILEVVILSVCLLVCLSVTHVLCTKTSNAVQVL